MIDTRREVEVLINGVYKDIKGNNYLVLAVSEPIDNTVAEIGSEIIEAIHTETNEKINIVNNHHNNCEDILVIYMCLFGENKGKIYAKPIKLFTSFINKEKYPNTSRFYEFEIERNIRYLYEVDKDTPETMGKRYALMGYCKEIYGSDSERDPYRGMSCMSCPIVGKFCNEEYKRPLYSKGMNKVLSAHTESIKRAVELMENRRNK